MKTTNKSKLIKQLANEFSSELTQLPVTVLPNDDIVYEEYLIKQDNGSWELYNIENKDLISKFYLRSCALIAAKFYKKHQFNDYRDVRLLDRQYQKSHIDTVLHRHSIKNTDDFDKKVILLNRLECSEVDAENYKVKISKLFKKNFV